MTGMQCFVGKGHKLEPDSPLDREPVELLRRSVDDSEGERVDLCR